MPQRSANLRQCETKKKEPSQSARALFLLAGVNLVFQCSRRLRTGDGTTAQRIVKRRVQHCRKCTHASAVQLEIPPSGIAYVEIQERFHSWIEHPAGLHGGSHSRQIVGL